jgi:hypothetical protein
LFDCLLQPIEVFVQQTDGHGGLLSVLKCYMQNDYSTNASGRKAA